MARILREEVRWAELNPPPLADVNKRVIGRLILSQDIFNKRSGTVIAMTLSSVNHKKLVFRLPIH